MITLHLSQMMRSERPNPRVLRNPADHHRDSYGGGRFHRGRHQWSPDMPTVWDLRWREHNAWWFVHGIRQTIHRPGETAILEQINQFGDHIYLGRLWGW